MYSESNAHREQRLSHQPWRTPVKISSHRDCNEFRGMANTSPGGIAKDKLKLLGTSINSSFGSSFQSAKIQFLLQRVKEQVWTTVAAHAWNLGGGVAIATPCSLGRHHTVGTGEPKPRTPHRAPAIPQHHRHPRANQIRGQTAPGIKAGI